MPDGTTRVLQFIDSTLRENAMQKISLAITVKGDRMILDFRGSSPQFLNRAVNTNIASFKASLCTGLLQNIWPDLPHTMAVLSPMEIITDRNSILDADGEMPQAMSLMPLFKGCVVWTIPMNKFNYSLPHRYSAIIASQYDQAATFIYGGMTQHGDVTGNFCADINGNGQGARSHADGEHSISPVFGFMCNSGEHEIAEEDTPIIRLGAQRLAKDRIGWGKYRAGLGYEQIATARGSGLWEFMTGCEGSKFPSAQGLFGGYSCPSYQLMKIKGINVFEVLRENPRAVEVFDIVELMNKQPIKGGKYSSNDMGMTFEVCNEGEIYMICQGSGGGYGDVLERDLALVMKDLAEDLMSHENARDIYKVVYDEKTLVVDEAATKQLRDEYRQERIRRGKPFDEFCAEWVTSEPPAHIPYFGSWSDNKEIFATSAGQRIKLEADKLQGVFMPNPKDVRIAELEAEVSALHATPRRRPLAQRLERPTKCGASAMGAFIELLKRPGRASVVWLDSHNYAGRLLAGGAPPWLDVAAFVAWQRKAQGLLKSNVASLPVAPVVAAWLETRPDLREAMGAKTRAVYPLKVLLADEMLREHLVEMARGMRSAVGGLLALALPSPRAWGGAGLSAGAWQEGRGRGGRGRIPPRCTWPTSCAPSARLGSTRSYCRRPPRTSPLPPRTCAPTRPSTTSLSITNGTSACNFRDP